MKPGPVPKVTHLPLSGGNNKPQYTAPECPKHITGSALDEWNRMIDLLVRYKMITNIDTAALALYCDSYGQWQDAKAQQEKLKASGGDGMIIKSPNGYPIHNPYLSLINSAKRDTHKYMQELGLSPAARMRVVPASQGVLDFGEETEEGKNYFT